MVSGFTKKIDINIKQNTIELKDSIFRYEPFGYESSFISFETVSEQFYKVKAKEKWAMVINFYKDSKTTDYQRSVFSILDCWGLIGGVNELLKVCGGLTDFKCW